jgi:glutathione synthase/RimK-type ligase-like ATP-grasp enzyme
MKTVAIVFSTPLEHPDPLGRTGEKRPVYIELLRRCQKKGWQAVICTRKTYQGQGVFKGYWKLKEDDSFEFVNEEIHVDLVYDRSGGRTFPPQNDSLIVVDNRAFKHLAWDKWKQYQEIGKYMPKTILIDKRNLQDQLSQLQTDWVVLKPTNGLKGFGIYIGPKEDALTFTFPDKFTKYIACEFVETKNGIPGIANGRHDLRVVIINGKAVWSHVRIPPEGEYKANLSGRNGGTLKEIRVSDLPYSVLEIVKDVSQKFLDKYDNPIYSLDFGFDKQSLPLRGEKGKPWIFELNDQIGFPRPNMEAKDLFLEELVNNFASKLSN